MLPFGVEPLREQCQFRQSSMGYLSVPNQDRDLFPDKFVSVRFPAAQIVVHDESCWAGVDCTAKAVPAGDCIRCTAGKAYHTCD